MSKVVRFAMLGAAVAAPIGAYAMLFRPWMRRWGAEPADATRTLPGDDLVAEPTVVETRVLTMDAAPEDAWPWLVQMGYGKAGWYSYDQMDQKGHSATEIMPEWQGLSVGDTVPTHPGGGFVAKVLEPGHALVLYVDSAIAETWNEPAAEAAEAADAAPLEAATSGLKVSGAMLNTTLPREFAGSWAFVIEPTDDGRARLVERLRFRFAGQNMVAGPLALEAMGAGVFLMLRKQMLGIRERAERLAEARLPAPVAAPFEPAAT